MRTNILLVGLLMGVLLVSGVAAQEPQDKRDFQPAQFLTDLRERLKLTEDQTAQIRPLIQEQVQNLRDLMEQYKTQGIAGRQSLQAEIQKFREEVKSKITPLLTDAQKQELQKYYEEIREKANETVKEGIVKNFADRLKLTQEQLKQVTPVLKENIEKRRELVEKFQEQGREAIKSFREEHQKLEEETAQRLKDLLNSDQLKELQELQEELKEKIRQQLLERRQNRPQAN